MSRRRLLGGAAVLGAASLAGAVALGWDDAMDALEGPTLARRCSFGAYPGGSDLISDAEALQQSLGARLPVFSWFKDWGAGWDQPLAEQIAALGGERAPACVTAWEAHGISFREILNGSHDAFVTDFVAGAAAYPGPVVLRLFHEMNGDWYPWAAASPESGVENPAQWQEAWRHVVGLARRVNAPNVRFMFCVNGVDVGGHPFEEFWPGREWVDELGIDGYNWGWHGQAPTTSAQALIDAPYRRLQALHPGAPVSLAEIGCVPGDAQAQWYADLLELRTFEHLESVTFFNEDGDPDFRITEDPATLKVLGAAIRRSPTTQTLPRA